MNMKKNLNERAIQIEFFKNRFFSYYEIQKIENKSN